MQRKQSSIANGALAFVAFITVLATFAIRPTSASAQEQPASCTAKPRMQKQVIASLPQSTYQKCLVDKTLCENMQGSEPESEKKELLATAKKATDSSKVAIAKPSPSIKPSPSPLNTASAATPVPTLPPQNTGGALSADKLFDMINAHRAGKGLPAYQKEDRLCQLAQSRGPELHNEIYGSGYIHQGLRERNLPFWITENMISKPTEEAAMSWWLNSSIHRAGIESSKQYACGVCVANSCAMLFTSWEPK